MKTSLKQNWAEDGLILLWIHALWDDFFSRYFNNFITCKIINMHSDHQDKLADPALFVLPLVLRNGSVENTLLKSSDRVWIPSTSLPSKPSINIKYVTKWVNEAIEFWKCLLRGLTVSLSHGTSFVQCHCFWIHFVINSVWEVRKAEWMPSFLMSSKYPSKKK